MIPVTEALSIVASKTNPLGAERVLLARAVGRVLLEDIVADTDLPPFDRSQMDGYAVIAADTTAGTVRLKIVGESAAGKGWHKKMKRGEAVRIMTGAPVPAGSDSVQKVEVTRESSQKGIETVEILEPVKNGANIVKQGAEIKHGTTTLEKGQVITENMIAAIASFGYTKVTAGTRPRVAIMSTGSEVVDVSMTPGRDQIRNSNSPMLNALVKKYGGRVKTFPIAGDDLKSLKKHITNAAKGRDILIITGGVSVGKYDLTKAALISLGAELYFEKLRLKPGKPAVFAKLNETLVFGLPGNPVSAAVTFHLFVRLAIMQMQGAADTQMRTGFAALGHDSKAAKDRDTYLPSKLETDKKGTLIATPLKWLGSSDFIGFARADSLIFIPAGTSRKAGDVVEIKYL